MLKLYVLVSRAPFVFICKQVLMNKMNNIVTVIKLTDILLDVLFMYVHEFKEVFRNITDKTNYPI